jgi:hypothetical protein
MPLHTVREQGENVLNDHFVVGDDGSRTLQAGRASYEWTFTDDISFHFVELGSGICFTRYHTHARAVNLRWVERVEGGQHLGEVMREGRREGVKALQKSSGAPPPPQQQRQQHQEQHQEQRRRHGSMPTSRRELRGGGAAADVADDDDDVEEDDVEDEDDDDPPDQVSPPSHHALSLSRHLSRHLSHAISLSLSPSLSLSHCRRWARHPSRPSRSSRVCLPSMR